MKLMFTLRNSCLTLNTVVIGNYQYIRRCDEPLRITEMPPMDLLRVSRGTVMPKHWIR